MGPRGVSRLLQQLLPTPGTTQCSNAAHVSYRVSTTLRSLTVLQSSSSCYIGTQQAHPTACPLVSDMLVSDSAAAATSGMCSNIHIMSILLRLPTNKQSQCCEIDFLATIHQYVVMYLVLLKYSTVVPATILLYSEYVPGTEVRPVNFDA